MSHGKNPAMILKNVKHGMEKAGINKLCLGEKAGQFQTTGVDEVSSLYVV